MSQKLVELRLRLSRDDFHRLCDANAAVNLFRDTPETLESFILQAAIVRALRLQPELRMEAKNE